MQFAVNARIWLQSVFGHAREMDDLFWRSIVWAARKPLAAHMVPPFVCLSIDDCNGRSDFQYAEIAHRHRYVSLPTMNIDVVPQRLYPQIRRLVESGAALFNTHALDYYELLCYNFGCGECTTGELDERFAVHDAFWKKLGVRHSQTFRGHWGEYGVRALPYLKQRGMPFLNPVLLPGLLKIDQGNDLCRPRRDLSLPQKQVRQPHIPSGSKGRLAPRAIDGKDVDAATTIGIP